MDLGPLLSAFGLVFLAELGDKTQLAVVTQTCKYRRPWPVFLGGSLALTAVTALGVAGGSLLRALVPQGLLTAAAAAAFLVMGALIWREVARRPGQADPDAELCGCEDLSPSADEQRARNWRAFGSTLALLFVAELGDKTQLAVLGLTARQAGPWAIFAGGALALCVVTGLGVLGGQQLCRLVPERVLLRASAIAFALMGILVATGLF